MVELAKATAVQQRLEASQAAARERTAARKAESAAVAANGESPAQFLAALAADSEALTRYFLQSGECTKIADQRLASATHARGAAVGRCCGQTCCRCTHTCHRAAPESWCSGVAT